MYMCLCRHKGGCLYVWGACKLGHLHKTKQQFLTHLKVCGFFFFIDKYNQINRLYIKKFQLSKSHFVLSYYEIKTDACQTTAKTIEKRIQKIYFL